jgi:hypothetical protein
MKKFIYIALLISLFCLSAFAQTEETKKEKTECPTIEVTGPPAMVKPGEMMTFNLKINGEFDKEKLKIKWSIDKGTIVQGRGTKSLTVIDTEKTGGITVTADVIVGQCNLSGSEASIICKCPQPIFIDEFGDIQSCDMKARLDTFLVELQNNPGSQGYIINYGTSKNVAKRERFIRDQLKFREYPLSNIVFVNGGKEEKIRTRLWQVPPGADASTID